MPSNNKATPPQLSRVGATFGYDKGHGKINLYEGEPTMNTTISVEVPSDLAQQLVSLKPYLAEIFKLGLQHWHAPSFTLTPRQQVEQLWANTDLIVPYEATWLPLPVSSIRQKPVQAGGKPASEIIIEQRGPLP